MAAKLIFSTSNQYSQGAGIGICTAVSLAWAKASLKQNGGINSLTSITPSFHALNAQMAVIRKFDNNPKEQTERAGLEIVSEGSVSTFKGLVETVKKHPPYIAIFWNSHHTMGYRYGHHSKDFFDIEQGLFRAKYTKDIVSKMEEVFNKSNYASIQGYRVVRLPG